MEVSVSSDIGTDGAVPIVIRIPKAVSQDGISLSGIVVDPSLFSIQGIDTSSDPDYQIITVTPLNASVDTAFSGSFTVEFKASGAYSRDDYTIQGTEFSANYSGQTTSETRDFEYTAAGPATPVLDKWPSCSNIDVDGTSVCGLQQGEPQQNSFSLPVNYAQLSIPDAVVTDVAPSYTTIGSGNGVGGQLGPDISGVRIYKISFDADHYVDTVTNVTNSFVGKVTVSGNQLSVDFGDLTPDDSYAINYGLELHDENGLMEDNTATLTSSGIGGSDDTSLTVTYPCAPVNYRSGGLTFEKSVDQQSVTLDLNNHPTVDSLEYTLHMHVYFGTIPVGTVINDALDSTAITGVADIQESSDTATSYDAGTNTLQILVQNDEPVGSDIVVKFRATLADTISPSYTLTNAFDSPSLQLHSNMVNTSFVPDSTMVMVAGEKSWDDADNQDGSRPESITVHLLENGTPTTSVVVDAANGWTYSFGELPARDADGNPITYSVSEDPVPGYHTTVDGFDLVNSHEPQLTPPGDSATPPQTGVEVQTGGGLDSGDGAAVAALLLILGAGAAVVAARKRD